MNMELEDHDLHAPPEPERRNPIASYIPEHGSLKNLDLDAELYSAYAKAKNYLSDLQSDDEIPPNQVAQVFNTISAILKEIVKMQTELHSAERVKKLEAAMISAIKLAPKESQDAFFMEYEAILKGQ